MLDYETTLDYLNKAKDGDNKAKEELIKNNIQLIKSIVNRYKYKQVEYDDLMQIGTIGLLKAIDNFDLKFNCKFSTYAVPMIIGEIKRFIRDDGIIKVSRSIKQLNYKIQQYVNNYQVENEKSPTVEEIATKFNIEPQEVVFTMDSSKYPVSIYEKVDEDSLSLVDKIESKETQEDLITKIMIKQSLEKLSLRDRKVIYLRYFRDQTQSQVAKVLGVSQVQVSRIESKALEILKNNLTE